MTSSFDILKCYLIRGQRLCKTPLRCTIDTKIKTVRQVSKIFCGSDSFAPLEPRFKKICFRWSKFNILGSMKVSHINKIQHFWYSGALKRSNISLRKFYCLSKSRVLNQLYWIEVQKGSLTFKVFIYFNFVPTGNFSQNMPRYLSTSF